MAKNKDIEIDGHTVHQHYSFDTKEYYYSSDEISGISYRSKESISEALRTKDFPKDVYGYPIEPDDIICDTEFDTSHFVEDLGDDPIFIEDLGEDSTYLPDLSED